MLFPFCTLTRSVGQATLLNSYLVQLLDNGFLHADPHPGNFLLQDDGTLCVLDFGLMTEVRHDATVACRSSHRLPFTDWPAPGHRLPCNPLLISTVEILTCRSSAVYVRECALLVVWRSSSFRFVNSFRLLTRYLLRVEQALMQRLSNRAARGPGDKRAELRAVGVRLPPHRQGLPCYSGRPYRSR